MDTERDEYQNLKSDVEDAQHNSHNQPSSTPELDSEIEHTDSDYTDDQNNSNTGYTEKLLEKEFQNEQNNGYENDIEDDPVVKNGNVVIDGINPEDKDMEYGNQSNRDNEF